MDDMNSESMLVEKVDFIILQLESESDFLDAVIESNLELQALLRIGRKAKERDADSEPPAEIASRITRLKEQLSSRFQPIKTGRDAMQDHIRSIHSSSTKPLTAKELARRVPEPQRSQLTQLRNEIRSKLNRIQAISMGNQAVLVYTMDFYNRLLNGLAPRPADSSGYDASGSSTGAPVQRFPGNFIQTTC